MGGSDVVDEAAPAADEPFNLAISQTDIMSPGPSADGTTVVEEGRVDNGLSPQEQEIVVQLLSERNQEIGRLRYEVSELEQRLAGRVEEVERTNEEVWASQKDIRHLQ